MKSRGLLSSSLIYGLGAVANRLATLLLLPVFTAYLTPSDYGVVGMLSTLGLLFTPVFSFGLGTSIGICYFASANKDSQYQVIRSAFMILLLSAMCMVLLASLLGNEISSWVLSGPEFNLHVMVSTLGVGFGLLAIPFLLRLQFENRPIAFVICSLLGLAGNLGLSCLMVIHFQAGAMGLILGTAFGQALTLVMSIIHGFHLPRLKDILSPSARELFILGLPMIPSFFLLFFLQNAVRWPLEWERGLHDVGLFTIGTNFGLAMTVFTGGVVAAWLPHALSMAERWEEGRQELARSFLQYFAVAGLLVLLFFVGAQPILKLFAANDFFPAWPAVGLSALTQFLISLYSLVLPPLYLAKKVSLVLVPQAIASLIIAAPMLWLVQFGVLGAGLVVTIGALALVILTFWTIRWSVRDILPIPYNMTALAMLSVILAIGASLSFMLKINDLVAFCIGGGLILCVSAVLVVRIAEIPILVLVRKAT